jgi:hypothetical protein
MRDYRSIGLSLQERWLRRGQELQQTMAAVVKSMRHRPEDSFVYALVQHARGDSALLIDYLQSDRPLSAVERVQFAQVLAGELDRKTERGRPRNKLTRTAAMRANVFYKMWRKENKEAGLKDHGHGGDMKDEALHFILDKFDPPAVALDFDTVRELMDRPEGRRKL